MEKEYKKAKWLSREALQIAVKRREVKSKGEKERYKHLNAEFQRHSKFGYVQGRTDRLSLRLALATPHEAGASRCFCGFKSGNSEDNEAATPTAPEGAGSAPPILPRLPPLRLSLLQRLEGICPLPDDLRL